MNKTLHTVRNIILWTLLSLTVLSALFLAGIRIFGLQPFAVLSNSMEPEYHTGDLLYIRKVDYTTLKEGDVITYMIAQNEFTTHRIIEVLPDEKDPSVIRYRTQGDHNDTADSGYVHCQNVIGIPVLSIPLLGYFANFISTSPGIYISLVFCILIILLAFLPEFRKKRAKKASTDKT